jgi:hypothetical protein
LTTVVIIFSLHEGGKTACFDCLICWVVLVLFLEEVGGKWVGEILGFPGEAGREGDWVSNKNAIIAEQIVEAESKRC